MQTMRKEQGELLVILEIKWMSVAGQGVISKLACSTDLRTFSCFRFCLCILGLKLAGEKGNCFD